MHDECLAKRPTFSFKSPNFFFFADADKIFFLADDFASFAVAFAFGVVVSDLLSRKNNENYYKGGSFIP